MKYTAPKCQQIARRPESENLWGSKGKRYGTGTMGKPFARKAKKYISLKNFGSSTKRDL